MQTGTRTQEHQITINAQINIKTLQYDNANSAPVDNGFTFEFVVNEIAANLVCSIYTVKRDGFTTVIKQGQDWLSCMRKFSIKDWIFCINQPEN